MTDETAEAIMDQTPQVPIVHPVLTVIAMGMEMQAKFNRLAIDMWTPWWLR